MGFKRPVTDEKLIVVKRWPADFTTDEIKSELGNFEREYEEACTGNRVNNPAIGNTFQGVVDMAMGYFQAITKKEINGKEVWFVTRIGYPIWCKKTAGMTELRSRRSFAKKKELQHLEKQAETIGAIDPADELGFNIPLEDNIGVPENERINDDREWEEKNGIKISDIPF